MNKVGVITFHRTSNFGSCLQAFGLCRKIADLGHEYELIDYRCPAIESREEITGPSSWNLRSIAKRFLYQPIIIKKYKKLMGFLERNTKISPAYTPDTIHQANDFYDKIMVGSDIVWGLDITKDDYNYFLDFVKAPVKKLAFASSVGEYDGLSDTQRVAALLSDFDRIAVREEKAVAWVRRLSGQESNWVCDPTMLLTAEQWDAYLQPKTYKSDYVLVYFQDNHGKSMKDAQRYAREHGLKVRYINYAVLPPKGVHSEKPSSLAEFVGLIRNAKFVFTASYHGMLFALYYHKDFVFYTRAHSDRVLSLAKRLGVEKNCADAMDIHEYAPADYQQVEEKMQTFRAKSVEVLSEMLRL
ncbi:MAG: polysaccharide pyruvyl transferase family protein [Oscillospiraceae bacterium]|nr:polysaccharide pyruvyl transferase family protein [Oscillospiraceae bacterium]